MARRFVHDVRSPRVVFGVGSRRDIPDEVRVLGRGRVLLIGGRHEKPYADEVADALGSVLAARIDEVAEHVPAAVADRATGLAERCAADLLLSIGGGSATGLAKAVALSTRLPIMAVPTTYAGSEQTTIWGVTRDGVKTTGRDPVVLPAVVIYDPELTTSLPPHISAASGMNAMAHLVEGLYAPDASPIVELLAEEGARVLAGALPRLVTAPSDLDARSDALYGAWLAGCVLGATTMGLHHRICHVLGGAYDLPHAGLHAALLPFVAAYNAPAAPAAMARLARALGAGDPARALWQLAHDLGAPTSLAMIGFDSGRIDEAAQSVVTPRMANPRPVSESDVRELLAAAHRGTLR